MPGKSKSRESKRVSSLADLTPDPANARRHDARNIGAIEDSLGRVGFARSIVIDEDGVVLAGNGTIEAAGRAGMERVRVVDADGEEIIAVRRIGLSPRQKAILAVGDNRAAELSPGWDAAALAALAEEHGIAPGDLELSDEEWKAIEAGAESGESGGGAEAGGYPEPEGGRYSEQAAVIVVCPGEAEQEAVYRELRGRYSAEPGYNVKVVNT